ncbi:integrase [Actinomadura sp. KC06]|uniref:tyrosine-type recombinase/integrase n=1 Tax=Actinomadura sp. KC06 TaxID=2530369 RepID=UPI001046FC41|nr:tyrosine-type recombinase/integrase [Actinomadura sp. KC06]TDD27356.1 integrase [Actinomadura sp. KC06]
MTDEPTRPGTGSDAGSGLSGLVLRPAESLQPAGARERKFPEHDLDGAGLILTAATAPPPAENPGLVYLATIAEGESRRAMAGCLDRIAGLWAVHLDIEPPQPAGQYFDWAALRYQHTAVIRAMLQAQTKPDGSPWAPSYRNKHLVALRMTLKQAFLLGRIGADDYMRAREIKSVKGVRVAPGRFISPDEHRAMVDAALADGDLIGIRDAALLAALDSTGCRREELANARRDDYDPGTRTLLVTGKGDNQREVYLTETAAAQLGAWLVAAQPRGPLFPAFDRWGNVTAAHMTSNGVGRVVTRRAEQAGVPDVTAHDYRRTFASRLLDLGVDLATVQRLMGHASASTTAGYDRRPAAAMRAAVDRINRAD